jgi:hypothetical protein
LIAAARIATATVTCVSNIYNNYIAHKLITGQQADRRKARGALQKKSGWPE